MFSHCVLEITTRCLVKYGVAALINDAYGDALKDCQRRCYEVLKVFGKPLECRACLQVTVFAGMIKEFQVPCLLVELSSY